MSPSAMADAPRRLHPLSVLFRLAGYLRQLIILIVIGLFASGEHWELAAAVFLIPLAVYEVLNYFRTTYRLSEQQLIVRRGVLFRSERHIPYVQIQNVDLVENLLHRLFGVAEVRIETASGAEPEAVLRVLRLGEVQRLRERIFAGRRRPDFEAPPARPLAPPEDSVAEPAQAYAQRPDAVELLHLSPADLVKLGLITFRGLVIVGVALGAVLQFDLHERIVERLERLDSLSIPTGGVSWPVLLAGFILAGLLGVTLLSVAWALVTLYDYRLIRVGDDLRVTCGLLTRLSATIPRQRVQLVSVRRSLLHRLFGSVSISIETAGGSGEAENVPVSRRWLVPLAPAGRLAELLREIQPEFRLAGCVWQSLSAAGRRRIVRKTAIVSGLLLGVLVAMLEVWTLPPFLPAAQAPRMLVLWAVPAAGLMVWALWILHAWAAARAIGYAEHATGVAFRSGLLVRRESTTNFDRIQVVSLGESPFDRRWRMATLAVDTAGAGPAGHRIRVACLERPLADHLRSTIVSKTAETDFSWL